jgi:hypothetical protein
MDMMRTVLSTLLVALVAVAAGYSQSGKAAPEATRAAGRLKAHASTQVQRGSTVTTKDRALSAQQKLKLLSIGAVSPNELTQIPRANAQSSKQKPANLKTKQRRAASAEDSSVSEFQAVSQGFGSSPAALALPANGSKKSRLKNVHGEVDGALGSGIVGGNQIGAAAGATSKSGKTSIFVQTNHATTQEAH